MSLHSLNLYIQELIIFYLLSGPIIQNLIRYNLQTIISYSIYLILNIKFITMLSKLLCIIYFHVQHFKVKIFRDNRYLTILHFEKK